MGPKRHEDVRIGEEAMIQLASNARFIAEVKTVELQHHSLSTWHKRMLVPL